jgi:hypothetical protein
LWRNVYIGITNKTKGGNKMKKILCFFLFLTSSVCWGTWFRFDDKGTHEIDWDMGAIKVLISMGTTVRLVEGGVVPEVMIQGDYNTFVLDGGTVKGQIALQYDLNTAYICNYNNMIIISGTVNKISLGTSNSRGFCDYNRIVITGGVIMEGSISAGSYNSNGNSVVFIGNDFAVKEKALDYGTYNYVGLQGGGGLTGTLLNGDELKASVYLSNLSHSVTLIPSLENLPPVCENRPTADLNYDCVVDMLDMALLARQWLSDGWAD